MKKLMLFAGLLCLQSILYAHSTIPNNTEDLPIKATERAQTHFKTHFNDAYDATWYNLGTDNTYCVYHSGEVTNRIFYDHRGNWRYTLKSYGPNHLDPEVRSIMDSEFSNYQVSYVNEILSDAMDPVYVINLENSKNIQIVRVAGDEYRIQQSLNK